MDIGEKIKNARRQYPMTQVELAEVLGTSQKDVSRWENGSRTPSLEKFAQICKALHVSADDILEIR